MKKLLIANRGEIAIRIARAAKDYGIASVAIYAEADSAALHTECADEAYALGPGRPAETYLNIEKIIAIAKRCGADAVHPGYGFLSERAEFAEAVLEAGLIWVGPPPQVIRSLGDKIEARRIAESVDAPLVKASAGPLKSAAEAVAFARQTGLPVAIKAAFGGGGRGMKVAHRIEEVAELYDSAVREALEAFGRAECYGEEFLFRPRHIEAQVLADQQGNIIVLGTRDCSLQRRNQKLIEEAPAPFITEEQRGRIHEAARAICAKAGYIGAGTVEFLLSQSGVISFLEVNTRLQVEHPVTEVTSGLDIVIEQLRVADGLPLSVKTAPEPRGHAIEFRINAEDPGRGFLPTPGPVVSFRPPSGPGVRLDSGVESGSVISGLYDSLMAKLIIHGATREEALRRARRALDEFRIEGVATVLPFCRAVLDEPAFNGAQEFGVYTSWIETEFRAIAPAPRVSAVEPQMLRSFIEIDGKRMTLALPCEVFAATGALTAPLTAASPPAQAAAAAEDGGVYSPMPGTLLKWLVRDGDQVAPGDPLAVVEAMKMETTILAEAAGRLQILADAGSAVSADAKIAEIG